MLTRDHTQFYLPATHASTSGNSHVRLYIQVYNTALSLVLIFNPQRVESWAGRGGWLRYQGTAVCQKLTNKYDTQQAGSSAFRLALYIATVFMSSNYAADGTAIYIK